MTAYPVDPAARPPMLRDISRARPTRRHSAKRRRMTRPVTYRWNLRHAMAAAKLDSCEVLADELQKLGVPASAQDIEHLMDEKPESINLSLMMGLLRVLNCSIEELIEPGGTSSALTGSDPKRSYP
jgi:DNA-binding Xre family transcriptional regulator